MDNRFKVLKGEVSVTNLDKAFTDAKQDHDAFVLIYRKKNKDAIFIYEGFTHEEAVFSAEMFKSFVMRERYGV